jgi:hypothetical protein
MATQLETARGIIRVPTGIWTVDPVHSSVEFRVKHMMISTVRGRFGEFEGMIEAAPDYHDSKVRGTVKAGPRKRRCGMTRPHPEPPGEPGTSKKFYLTKGVGRPKSRPAGAAE